MVQRPNILIINDGNRRWAKANGLTIRDGYKKMVERVVFICDELKIRGFEKVYVTFCSKNNLYRPEIEVNTFYEEYLKTPELSKNKIKVELHGNLDLIPVNFKDQYNKLTEKTSTNSDFVLHYMINWSIDDEIVRIYNRLHDKFPIINSEILNKNSDIKDPIDLIIRTGNKKRLSSCIPFNSPFAEIYFIDILFPEFDSIHIDNALDFYRNQIRTYGK